MKQTCASPGADVAESVPAQMWHCGGILRAGSDASAKWFATMPLAEWLATTPRSRVMTSKSTAKRLCAARERPPCDGPTSAPGFATFAPRLGRICAGTRLTSAPGLGPHLRRDLAHACAGTRDRSCAAWVRCARDSPALGLDEALGACLVQWTRSSRTWTGTRGRSSRATGTSARTMRPIPLAADPTYGRSHLSGSLVSGQAHSSPVRCQLPLRRDAMRRAVQPIARRAGGVLRDPHV